MQHLFKSLIGICREVVMNLVRAHVTPMAAWVCPGVRGRVFQFCACKVGARKQNSLPPSQARGAGKRTLGYDSLSWRSKLAFEKHSHEHFPSHHISVLVMALPATFPTVHHSPAVKEIFGSFKHEFFFYFTACIRHECYVSADSNPYAYLSIKTY